VLGEKQRVGWRYKAVGRGVMRCGLWQTAQEKDREGSPLKVCLIAIALHWPLQVTLFRSQGLHGHQAMAVDLWCPALYLFPGLKKIRYTRKKILQRWQQLTRHRVAMAVRGNLYGTKIYRQEIASVFGFVLRSAYPISGLFGFFFQPEQCFSLTTFQPEQYFSAEIQQAERGQREVRMR